MMAFKFLILGFFVKILTGFDDMIARMPLVASVTKKKQGMIAFSIGTLLAVLFAIVMATSFATFMKEFEAYKYIVATPIFILAGYTYFSKSLSEPKKERVKEFKREISKAKFTQLIVIGFVASVLTLLDDFVVYVPLLAGTLTEKFNAVLGILLGTGLQVVLILHASNRITQWPRKKEIASLGLIIFGILVITGVI